MSTQPQNQSGILSQLMSQMNLAGLSIKPNVENNELKIVITQSELADMATRGIEGRFKGAIKVELHEGQMLLRVALF